MFYFAHIELKHPVCTVHKDKIRRNLKVADAKVPIAPVLTRHLLRNVFLDPLNAFYGQVFTLDVHTLLYNVEPKIPFVKYTINRAVVSGGAGGTLASPEFGCHVNPIPTRGGRLCPPHYC